MMNSLTLQSRRYLPALRDAAQPARALRIESVSPRGDRPGRGRTIHSEGYHRHGAGISAAGVTLSAGFSTIDFLQVEGRFTHYNFLGGARRLDAIGGSGKPSRALSQRKINLPQRFEKVTETAIAYFVPTYNASIDLRQPWFKVARTTSSRLAFSPTAAAHPAFT